MILGVCIAIFIVTGVSAYALYRSRSEPIAQPAPKAPGEISYLPLGDSYTIGSSIAVRNNWPSQLVARAQQDGIKLKLVDNPARIGYTSQTLIDRELPLVEQYQPDVVSVLIGVNDYVQGVPADTFRNNLQTILDTLQQQVAQPKNIFLVTIPDYAKTPSGAQYGDPTQATAAITDFNQIIAQEARARGLILVDIFPISQRAATDNTLTASDGLHPSAKQYTLWTDQIYTELTKQSLLKSVPAPR